jgi:hypothetical protein
MSDTWARVSKEDMDLDRNRAEIDGEEYPLFYAKIINIICDEEQPVILFLGKPGSGKSYAAAKLGYDLHHEIGYFNGAFTPEDNIHYDNLEFFKAVRYGGRKKVQVKEEVDRELNSLDYNQLENRKNGNVIGTSRILGSPLVYVGQFMNRADKDIKDLHTIRLVAAGGSNTYAFDVYYIDRDEDDPRDNYEKVFLQRWKPEKPPEEFCEYLEEKDENWKLDALEEDIEEVETQRENEKRKEEITMA